MNDRPTMAGPTKEEQNSTDIDDDNNKNNKDRDQNPTPKNEESSDDEIEEDPNPFTVLVEGFVVQHYGLWLTLSESCTKAFADIRNDGRVQLQGAAELAVGVPNLDSLSDKISKISPRLSLSDIQDTMIAPALRAYMQLFGKIQQDLKIAQEILRKEDMRLQYSFKSKLKKDLVRISKWALKLLQDFEKYLSDGRAAISNFPERSMYYTNADQCVQTEELGSEVTEINRAIQKKKKVELKKRVQKRDMSKYKDTLPYPHDFLGRAKSRESIELNFEEGFIKSSPNVSQELAKNDDQPNEVKVDNEVELVSQISREKSTDEVKNDSIPLISEIKGLIDSLTMIKSTYELENEGSSTAPSSNDKLSPITITLDDEPKKSEIIEPIRGNKSRDLVNFNCESFVLEKEVKESFTSLKSEVLSVLKVASDHDEQGEETNQMLEIINSLTEIESDMVNDEEIEPIVQVQVPIPIPISLNDKMSSNLAIYFRAKSETLGNIEENNSKDLMDFESSAQILKISLKESISGSAELVKESSTKSETLGNIEENESKDLMDFESSAESLKISLKESISGSTELVKEASSSNSQRNLPDLITLESSQNVEAKISFLKYAENVVEDLVNSKDFENVLTSKTSISSRKSQDFQNIESSIVANHIDSKKSKVIFPAEEISKFEQEIDTIDLKKSESNIIFPNESTSQVQQEIDTNYLKKSEPNLIFLDESNSKVQQEIDQNDSHQNVAHEIKIVEVPRKSSTKFNESKPKICGANFDCPSQISTVQVVKTESKIKTPEIDKVQKLKKFISENDTFINIFGISRSESSDETGIYPKYDQNSNIRVKTPPVTSKITEVHEIPVEVLFRFGKSSSNKTPTTAPIPTPNNRVGNNSSQKCSLPSKIPRLTSFPSKIPRPSSMPSKIPRPTEQIIKKDNRSVQSQSQSRQSKPKTGNVPKSKIPVRKF